jgi:hypothetical protein
MVLKDKSGQTKTQTKTRCRGKTKRETPAHFVLEIGRIRTKKIGRIRAKNWANSDKNRQIRTKTWSNSSKKLGECEHQISRIGQKMFEF